MMSIAEIEAQLAMADRLKAKPKPAPRVSRPVDPEDARRHPEDYVTIYGRSLAHRCTAQSRQAGRRCLMPVMKGMRVCRMHGGKNRGPVTPEGLAKCAKVKTVHGKETQQKRRDRKAGHARARILNRATKDLLIHEQRMRKAIRGREPA